MACVASEGRNESNRAKWQDASLALQTAVLERGGCCLLARFTYSGREAPGPPARRGHFD